MKGLIKWVNTILPHIRQTIFFIGLVFVFVFMTLSMAYIRGEAIADAKLDITGLIIGDGGMTAYCWVIIFFGWMGLEVIYWGFKIHNWWLHRADIKKEAYRELVRLKKLGSKITGNAGGD